MLLPALGIILTIVAPPGNAGGAQRSGPVLIGVLNESWGPTPAVVGLRDGLIALGHRENEDFVIGVRFTQGDLAALPGAARELIQRGAEVIVTGGLVNAAKAAQMATARIPIVFMGSSDPVGFGLVQSFARPGGNITGIADLNVELAPKRMELFRELVLSLKRVLLPYDASDPYTVAQLGAHRDAARRLGITLVEKPVRTEAEARAALAGVRKGEVEGILAPRSLSLNIPGFILEFAPRQVIPTMFDDPYWVERGGLASYSANYYRVGQQAARLVDKIIKGANPAEIPVEQPTRFELVINLKTAKALGLTIPPSVLVRTDRVIQ
jgi:putative ABC transport system substrate-binding protein